jgi:hypothetical protein
MRTNELETEKTEYQKKFQNIEGTLNSQTGAHSYMV